MYANTYEEHLLSPVGRGSVPLNAHVGSAGGSPCGDVVRMALKVEEELVTVATFDVQGCGAMTAAASACVSIVEGSSVMRAAAMSPQDIESELGGLSLARKHAARLVADALHRALAGHWRACLDGKVEAQELRRNRVLVAMSGGVDSAVAALIAKQHYTDVVAVTVKLWADEEGDDLKSCCSPVAVLGARDIAHSMGLPHLTLDVESDFRAAVVGDYLAEHRRGRTPNPCVRCNGEVRFDAMIALADAIGAWKLATGHYSRIAHDAQGPLLAPADDAQKDQAYMLAALGPDLLERLDFPLSGLSKPEVRKLARSAKLPVADKPESQDLCFLAGTERSRFLERHGGLRDKKGEIVDRKGKVLGRHGGYMRYTVGQRRGLRLANREPLYVLATDAGRNQVVVGPREQLAARDVLLRPVTLYRSGERVARVRLRYRSEAVDCVAKLPLAPGEHEALELELAADVLGVAPGQVACLYDDMNRVIGHGVISQTAVSTPPALLA